MRMAMHPYHSACLLHAATPAFKRLVARTEQRIRDALAIPDVAWSISFSGGKDSTVLLDLLHACMPDVPVIWSDDEAEYPETVAFVEQRLRACASPHVIAAHIRHGVCKWFTSWQDWPDGLHRPLPDTVFIPDELVARYGGGLQAYQAMRNFGGAFIGLRRAESGRRATLLRVRGSLFYARGNRVWECCPLADWTTRDVWAYILSRALAYNPVYDRLAALGIPPDRQRVGPLVIDKGIAVIKRGWPELFNRLAARYPQVRQWT